MKWVFLNVNPQSKLLLCPRATIKMWRGSPPGGARPVTGSHWALSRDRLWNRWFLLLHLVSVSSCCRGVGTV